MAPQIYPRLMVALGQGLVATFILSVAVPLAWGDLNTSDLRDDFLRLKTNFESSSRNSTDHQVLTYLATETAAMSWALAAAHLNRDNKSEPDWAKLADEFTKKQAKQPIETRHLSALKFYYQALVGLGRGIISKRNSPLLLSELTVIAKGTKATITKLVARQHTTLEQMQVLSRGMVDIFALIATSTGGSSLDTPLEAILDELNHNRNLINKQTDLHHQARQLSLYAANVKSLTALIFITGQSSGPPLSQMLTNTHRSLGKHRQGHGLAGFISITWTAQAQVAPPLAFWLVTNFSNTKNLK